MCCCIWTEPANERRARGTLPHRALDALLDQMLELPVADRQAWINGLDLSEAHKEVLRSLAQEDAPAGDWLDAGVGALLSPSAAIAVDGERNVQGEARIGRYRLLRLIGEGGSSVVRQAVRDDDSEQLVALKCLKTGLMTAALRERFMVEQRLLAKLAHPHIVQLLDVGIDDDHTPFLAMQYVDGRNASTTSHGGGIYLSGSVAGETVTNPLLVVERFGSLPSNVLGPRIAGNIAGEGVPTAFVHGGGIYAHFARVQLDEGVMVENAAGGLGGAIYADQGIQIGRGAPSANCGTDGICAIIDSNGSFAIAASNTYCSAVYAVGTTTVTRARFRGNVVAPNGFNIGVNSGTLCWEGAGGSLSVRSSEFVRNTGGGSVLSLGKAATLVGPVPAASLAHVTIADNALSVPNTNPLALASIWAGGTNPLSGAAIQIGQSLVDDPGFAWARTSSASTQFNVDLTIANNAYGLLLQPSSNVDVSNWFVNRAAADYRLLQAAGNPAIDTAVCNPTQQRDLVAQLPFDHPEFANSAATVPLVGYCDRGAREAIFVVDAIYSNGFE